jgi:hypothetical protein
MLSALFLLPPVLAVAVSTSASDLLSETRISLKDLAREQGVALSTCWRWTLRGVKGQQMKSFNVGQRRYTTREEFARWIAAINAEPVTAAATTQARRESVAAAERELDEVGI